MKFSAKNFLLVFTYILVFSQVHAQEKILDTLDQFWSSSKFADSVKLEKIHKLIWNDFLFSQPDKAFLLAEKHYKYALQANNKKYQASSLNTQGVSYGLRSEYGKAVKYYLLCLKIREKIDDRRGIANTLSNIGLSQKETGNYNSAIKNFTESLKIHEQLNNSKGQATALNNIGVIYLDQNNYKQAIAYFKKAMELYKKIDNNQGLTLAMTNLGLSHLNLKEYPKAKEYLNESSKLHEKINDKDGLARTLGFIAQVFYLEKNYDDAMVFQLNSLKIRQEIDDKSGISESLCFIADIHYSKGEFNDALKNGEKALEFAQETSNLKMIFNATNILYKANKSLGLFKPSLEMHELYIAARDSIQSEENHRAVVRQELTYKFEKQKAIDDIEAKRQISIVEEEKKKSNLILTLLSIGTLFIIVFLLALYQRFRVINKQKTTIEKQYKSIEEKTKTIIKIEKEKHEHELVMKRKDIEAVVANNNLQIKLKKELQSSLRIAQKSDNVNNEIQKIIVDLNMQIETQQKLNLLEANLQEVNANFFKELLDKHPSVSKTEKEICAYIKLGLSTKEIASLRNTTTNTINVTKTRLRNKLELKTNAEISAYLLQF